MNNATGETLSGEWRFDVDPQVSTVYEDDFDYLQAPKADVTNNVTGEQEEIHWRNLNLARKTIRFSEVKNDGIYYYKLVKQ